MGTQVHCKLGENTFHKLVIFHYTPAPGGLARRMLNSCIFGLFCSLLKCFPLVALLSYLVQLDETTKEFVICRRDDDERIGIKMGFKEIVKD